MACCSANGDAADMIGISDFSVPLGASFARQGGCGAEPAAMAVARRVAYPTRPSSRRRRGFKRIHCWLGFVRCGVASVLVSHSSVASATHVSDPIEECSTSVAELSLAPTTTKPIPAWTK